jgi:hypothetical protein
VRGELGESFSSTFEEVSLEHRNGTTLLTVDVIDQAQLHGIINRLRDYSLTIESVTHVSQSEPELEKGRDTE